MKQETSQPRQAMMSAVWEGLCNHIFCAVRTNMKLQAWQSSAMRSRLRRRTPPQETGGEGRDRGSEHPSGSLPAAPLPLALPLDLAVLLLAGQMAPLQELIGDPSWNPAG